MAETSPLIEKEEGQPLVDFYIALGEMRNGSRATRVAWQNSNVHGIMHDGKLHIMLADKKLHEWIIHETDIDAKDWIILEADE